MAGGEELLPNLSDRRIDSLLAQIGQHDFVSQDDFRGDPTVVRLRSNALPSEIFARLVQRTLQSVVQDTAIARRDPSVIISYATNVAAGMAAAEREGDETLEDLQPNTMSAPEPAIITMVRAYMGAVVDHEGYMHEETVLRPLRLMAQFVIDRHTSNTAKNANAPSSTEQLPFVLSDGFDSTDAFDPARLHSA